MFSGGFFLASFYYTFYTQNNQCPLCISDLKNDFLVALVISLFAGVIIYAFHRALPYALVVEPFINGERSKSLRKNKLFNKWRCTLITENTIRYLLRVWDMDGDGDGDHAERAKVRAGKMCPWGDYTHFHYTAAWCVVAGNLSYLIINNKGISWCPGNPVLCALFALFFVMGLVSDWRLKALRECIFDEDKTSV